MIKLKIVVCYKLVPVEETLKANSDRTLNLKAADWQISQYDTCALESGVRIAEKTGGEVIVLTVGESDKVENSKLRKAILARGADSQVAVAYQNVANADTYAIAETLAAAIKKIGDVDLVICAEGSGDLYQQQVGPALGQLLGYANMNGISQLEAGDGVLIAQRTLETEIENLEIPMPAVISTTSDICNARIPSLKEIMAAGKKPVTTWTVEETGAAGVSKVEIVSILAPEEKDRRKEIAKGEPAELAEKLFDDIRRIL